MDILASAVVTVQDRVDGPVNKNLPGVSSNTPDSVMDMGSADFSMLHVEGLHDLTYILHDKCEENHVGPCDHDLIGRVVPFKVREFGHDSLYLSKNDAALAQLDSLLKQYDPKQRAYFTRCWNSIPFLSDAVDTTIWHSFASDHGPFEEVNLNKWFMSMECAHIAHNACEAFELILDAMSTLLFRQYGSLPLRWMTFRVALANRYGLSLTEYTTMFRRYVTFNRTSWKLSIAQIARSVQISRGDVLHDMYMEFAWRVQRRGWWRQYFRDPSTVEVVGPKRRRVCIDTIPPLVSLTLLSLVCLCSVDTVKAYDPLYVNSTDSWNINHLTRLVYETRANVGHIYDTQYYLWVYLGLIFCLIIYLLKRNSKSKRINFQKHESDADCIKQFLFRSATVTLVDQDGNECILTGDAALSFLSNPNLRGEMKESSHALSREVKIRDKKLIPGYLLTLFDLEGRYVGCAFRYKQYLVILRHVLQSLLNISDEKTLMQRIFSDNKRHFILSNLSKERNIDVGVEFTSFDAIKEMPAGKVKTFIPYSLGVDEVMAIAFDDVTWSKLGVETSKRNKSHKIPSIGHLEVSCIGTYARDPNNMYISSGKVKRENAYTLFHTCGTGDTGGWSGAPIFTAGGIIGIHTSGYGPNRGNKAIDFALISLILDESIPEESEDFWWDNQRDRSYDTFRTNRGVWGFKQGVWTNFRDDTDLGEDPSMDDRLEDRTMSGLSAQTSRTEPARIIPLDQLKQTHTYMGAWADAEDESAKAPQPQPVQPVEIKEAIVEVENKKPPVVLKESIPDSIKILDELKQTIIDVVKTEMIRVAPIKESAQPIVAPKVVIEKKENKKNDGFSEKQVSILRTLIAEAAKSITPKATEKKKKKKKSKKKDKVPPKQESADSSHSSSEDEDEKKPIKTENPKVSGAPKTLASRK
jgi:hypothetical protein